ncbi:MAG: tryptophan synthase subunit alpha [Proteobacteria bacterium]|nr:tryptophan synthase subunit alpha [Pseudomonadota bacterium]
MSRIADRFAALRRERRAGFVIYTMGGDPDYATSLALLRGLPKAGADLIEIGMMFSDPMADGPAIQAAGVRAHKAGATLRRTLDLVAEFRREDQTTPIVLMGYYNPIYQFGAQEFAAEAKAAGADGLIVVDLPPEEDVEFRPHAETNGLDVIRLATPTTDAARLPAVLDAASGFLYYVAVLGVTGTKAAVTSFITEALKPIRKQTGLPIAVGFGIRTPAQAAEIARVADAAVVGSAFVQLIAEHLGPDGKPRPGLVDAALRFVGDLARAVRSARVTAGA